MEYNIAELYSATLWFEWKAMKLCEKKLQIFNLLVKNEHKGSCLLWIPTTLSFLVPHKTEHIKVHHVNNEK